MDESIYVYLSQILQSGHSVLTAVDEVMSAGPDQFNRAMSKLMRSVAALNDAKFELFKHEKGLKNDGSNSITERLKDSF